MKAKSEPGETSASEVDSSLDAYEAWYDEQIEQGLADIEAGRVLSDAQVQQHFEKRFVSHATGKQKKAA